MILTGRDLAEIGEALRGPRWRRWLAERLDRSECTIKRYEKGRTGIPRKVQIELRKVIRDQRAALDALEREKFSDLPELVAHRG